MRRISGLILLSLFFAAGCQDSSTSTPTGNPPVVPVLVVTLIQVPGTPVTTTAAWTLGATVTNNGTVSTEPSTLKYQLSTKSTLDASATLIGSTSVPVLSVGQSYPDTFSTSYSITQSGTHWIFVTADSTTPPSTHTLSATVAVIYDRIVVETYDPISTPTNFTTPFISLFGPLGDTTADISPNEWNNDASPYTVDGGVAIAETNGSAGTWVSIDYQGGLAPGVCYVRVRGAQSYQLGPYAIRFLTLPVGQALPAYTHFAGNNTADSPYESDNALQPGTGIPANPVQASPGTSVNRNLQASFDMDWFRLTLP